MCGSHYEKFRRAGNVPRTAKSPKLSIEKKMEFGAVRSANGCLLWRAENGADYGILTFRGRREYTHRIAYQLANGPIPSGAHVRHLCNATRCINPEHLALGTPQDNMDDKVRSNRQQHGEKCYNAVLTDAVVLTARALYAEGASVAELAAQANVHQRTMLDAIKGTTWKHLTEGHQNGED